MLSPAKADLQCSKPSLAYKSTFDRVSHNFKLGHRHSCFQNAAQPLLEGQAWVWQTFFQWYLNKVPQEGTAGRTSATPTGLSLKKALNQTPGFVQHSKSSCAVTPRACGVPSFPCAFLVRVGDDSVMLHQAPYPMLMRPPLSQPCSGAPLQ
ncbi:hypothetical protein ABBQ38_000166 [Trebouxia sp. C0009 RCD-2024]